MSTIFIAVLLMICTIGLPTLFALNSKRKLKKRNEMKLDFFLRSGAKNDLIFSKQEILEDKIIGLDEVNKTLLIYLFKNEKDVILINLVKVRTCTLKKNYENMNRGNERKVRMELHLASIDIVFGFKNGGDKPVAVSFYDSTVNNIYEMAGLEVKAKNWETILSTVLVKKFEATA